MRNLTITVVIVATITILQPHTVCAQYASRVDSDHRSSAMYRIAPSTVQDIWVSRGQFEPSTPLHTVAMTLWSAQPAPATRPQHHMPTRGQGGTPLLLRVESETKSDRDRARLHPFEQPLKRINQFWGCRDIAGPGQPRVLKTDAMTDDDVTARLAPSPSERSGQPRTMRASTPPSWVGRLDVRFPEELQMIGVHELRRDDSVMRFEVGAHADFLAPVKLRELAVGDDGSVRLQWIKVPNAVAYFVNVFIQRRASPDAFIWTSSRLPEGGWILAREHPGGEQLEHLKKTGVLLGPDVGECIVPSALTRNAFDALVIQVHAFGAEVPANVDPTGHTHAPRVSIAPRATASIVLTAPDNPLTARFDDGGPAPMTVARKDGH